MSKNDKLIMRLLSYPKDFTYNELKILLLSFGYKEMQGAGSWVCFSKETHKVKLHNLHPGNTLKGYQVDLIVEELANKGLIVKSNKNE